VELAINDTDVRGSGLPDHYCGRVDQSNVVYNA